MPLLPVLPKVSLAVSTSFAPWRMSAWQPRDGGEWIEPGMASTSRPWSVASRAAMSEPLPTAASTTKRSERQPADQAVAYREVLR